MELTPQPGTKDVRKAPPAPVEVQPVAETNPEPPSVRVHTTDGFTAMNPDTGTPLHLPPKVPLDTVAPEAELTRFASTSPVDGTNEETVPQTNASTEAASAHSASPDATPTPITPEQLPPDQLQELSATIGAENVEEFLGLYNQGKIEEAHAFLLAHDKRLPSENVQTPQPKKGNRVVRGIKKFFNLITFGAFMKRPQRQPSAT